MMKDKLIDGIVNRFRGKLVKMLVVNLMIIQFRLKLDNFYYIWGYETNEKDFFINSTN